MKAALRHLAVFLLWNLSAGAFLVVLGPLPGLAAALALTAVVFRGYVLTPPRGTSPTRYWAALRLRPVDGEMRKAALLAVPSLLALTWALGEVYTRLVPVPPESLNPFEEVLGTSGGRLAIAVFAIVVAPLMEEFFFRGLIQHAIERRRGAAAGVVGAAALFALIHFLPWVFPLHFFLGLAFGFAVWATRSIWTGVMLHAANNSVAMLAIGFDPDAAHPGETVWQSGLTAGFGLAVAALLLSGAASVWTARAMLRARAAPNLRSA